MGIPQQFAKVNAEIAALSQQIHDVATKIDTLTTLEAKVDALIAEMKVISDFIGATDTITGVTLDPEVSTPQQPE